MLEYRISKESCLKNISGRVCEGCGEGLSAIETVDNSGNPTFWAGCNRCQRFTGGVNRDIFDAVQNATSYMKAFSANIAEENRKFSDIFTRCLKYYKNKCTDDCPFFTFKNE